MMKVKASDKFMFPLSMDFGPYQSADNEQAAGSQIYDLHAILIHKGASASHGHYGIFTFPLHVVHEQLCSGKYRGKNLDVHSMNWHKLSSESG